MTHPPSQAGLNFSQGCRRVAQSMSPGQWEPREA